MNEKLFVSGDEAVALAVRQAKPHMVAAYPITPQTIVVERLSDFVEDGSLECEYLYVESEHSAMSACLGASAIGARTFTATSSQGLLYMVECLPYASGSRFPIVMMNANRSIAAPWSIYNDQRDSLSQLESGWIQLYVENAQEAYDMVFQAYKLAESPDVMLPVMINLDGFVLTHTYELIHMADQKSSQTVWTWIIPCPPALRRGRCITWSSAISSMRPSAELARSWPRWIGNTARSLVAPMAAWWRPINARTQRRYS